jgi:hypothetical protein
MLVISLILFLCSLFSTLSASEPELINLELTVDKALPPLHYSAPLLILRRKFSIITLLQELEKNPPVGVKADYFYYFTDKRMGAQFVASFLKIELPKTNLFDRVELDDGSIYWTVPEPPVASALMYKHLNKFIKILKRDGAILNMNLMFVEKEKEIHIKLGFPIVDRDGIYKDNFYIGQWFKIDSLLQRLSLDAPVACTMSGYATKKEGAQAALDFLSSELPKTKFFAEVELEEGGYAYTNIPVADGTMYKNLNQLVRILKRQGGIFNMNLQYVKRKTEKLRFRELDLDNNSWVTFDSSEFKAKKGSEDDSTARMGSF